MLKVRVEEHFLLGFLILNSLQNGSLSITNQSLTYSPYFLVSTLLPYAIADDIKDLSSRKQTNNHTSLLSCFMN